jgi:hypothetical protein
VEWSRAVNIADLCVFALVYIIAVRVYMYALYVANGKIRQFFFLYGAVDENYSQKGGNLVRQLNEEGNNSTEKVEKIVGKNTGTG